MFEDVCPVQGLSGFGRAATGTPPKRAALQHPSVSDCTEVHADAASDSTSNPSRAGTRDGGASASGGPDLPGSGADYGRGAGDARRTETSGVGSSSNGGPGDLALRPGDSAPPARQAAEAGVESSDAAAAPDAEGGECSGATPPHVDGWRGEAGGSADLAGEPEPAAQANGAPGGMRGLHFAPAQSFSAGRKGVLRFRRCYTAHEENNACILA